MQRVPILELGLLNNMGYITSINPLNRVPNTKKHALSRESYVFHGTVHSPCVLTHIKETFKTIGSTVFLLNQLTVGCDRPG